MPFLGMARNLDLRSLDRVIAKDYVTPRQHSLDSLRLIAGNSHGNKWELYDDLAGRYGNFDIDSALHYNSLAQKFASDPTQQTKSQLRLASLYNSSLMMYKEASDIFEEIRIDSVEEPLKKDYFLLGVQLYRNLEGLAPNDLLKRQYARVKQAFRDSVVKISPDEKFIRANELLDAGQPEMVIKLFADELKLPDTDLANGAMYHLISKAYGRMGDTDKEMDFLAKAAEADLTNGVREYLALPELALKLYEHGDVNHAYRYMQRSLEDAKACKARVRLFDMTETLSVISNAYAEGQRSTQMKLGIMLGLVCVMLCMAGVAIYYANQRNRLLSIARTKLEEGNSKLEEAGKVRERNVRQFMNLSREYLEYLDGYRARLFKTAAKRNFDTLFKAIKSSELIDSATANFFSNFDRSFLELYPDFIEEFNSLLRPEERIELKEPGTLNTDLRIFALMKLGITESSEIARFLHCSQSTIYNYRTRYRSKAIDKDKFVNHFFGE